VTAMFCPVAPEVASAPVPGPKNKFQPGITSLKYSFLRRILI